MKKKYKIIHIINNDKFIKAFIDFVEKNFNTKEHLFIFISGGKEKEFPIPKADNIVNINNVFSGKENNFQLSTFINPFFKQADKIILHSLFSRDLVNFLYFHQGFLKKCFWIMWGGDFYFPDKQYFLKKQIIKKIAYLVTGTTGDVELLRKWYGATGKHIKCFNYPSNLYKNYNISSTELKTINIQVGNSADPTNNHLDIFEKLKKYKHEDIMIYVPLSYGDQQYAKEIVQKGGEIFGNKFKAMMEFMPFDTYLKFLSDIDISIFNHQRQQAFGNIITLLGLGKKVYIHNVSTLNSVFKEYNITVYDINKLNIQRLDNKIKEKNIKNVKCYFSKQSLVNSLKQYLL